MKRPFLHATSVPRAVHAAPVVPLHCPCLAKAVAKAGLIHE